MLRRLSNRVQAMQMERVTTVCKAPKNGAMANVKGWNQDRPMTGHAPEPLCGRFKASNIVSDVSRKRKVYL